MFESVGQLIFAFRELWVECLGSRAAENVACSMRCANRRALRKHMPNLEISYTTNNDSSIRAQM